MLLAIEQMEREAAGARPVNLAFADTGGTPEGGIAAVDDLVHKGVVALVGEYHSVVPEAVARHVDAIGIPFLCASATLDAITARRSRWVFRLAPPQSYGWSVYADFLRGRGFEEMVAVVRPDLYWSSGAAVLERRLGGAGIALRRLEPSGSAAEVVGDR